MRLTVAAVSVGLSLAAFSGCGSSDSEAADGIDTSAAEDCEDDSQTSTSPEITVESDSVTVKPGSDGGGSTEGALTFLAAVGCVADELGAPTGTADILVNDGFADWKGVSATLSTQAETAIFVVE